MKETEQRQRGLGTFARVMGFDAPEARGDAFLEATIDHLFAEVWSRPALSVRDRRLITLTVLIGVGNELALKLHFGAAMASGDLSDSEIDELILHAAHYVGWPGAAAASQIVRQLRAERRSAK